MPVVTLEPIEGDSALCLQLILADRAVRIPLYGRAGDIGEGVAIQSWCGPQPVNALRRAARCAETRQIVGAVGVVRNALSFFVARNLWTMGYGTAMVRAVLALDAAWQSSTRRMAYAIRENHVSRRILTNAGFFESGLEWQAGVSPCLVKFEYIAR